MCQSHTDYEQQSHVDVCLFPYYQRWRWWYTFVSVQVRCFPTAHAMASLFQTMHEKNAHWKHIENTWMRPELTICSSRVSRSRTHFHMQTRGARAFEPFPAALPYLILIIINWNHVDDLTFFHPTLYKTQHLSSSDQIAEKELRAVFGMNHRCVCVCVCDIFIFVQ